MANQFTNVTTAGYGNRIVGSLIGVLIGLLFFAGSFALLYWNEGRVDISGVARTAVEIDSATVNTGSSLDGKLVSVTGTVNSSDTIGDNLFLKPDAFIAVRRKVEMYSWVEAKQTDTRNNTGGSSTTTTTYNYNKDWAESPADSGVFKYPADHQNPQKSLEDYSGYAKTATVGAYSFDPSTASLPDFKEVALTAQNTTLSNSVVLANENYLFVSHGNNSAIGAPMIGDLRISYYVLSPGFNGTIFGALHGNSIDSYSDQKGNTLYRLFAGTREQGIFTLHSEFTIWLWIFRAVGFLLMWIGLSLLFSPINVLLDILPMLGGLTGLLIAIATFFVALILTAVTIAVSIVAHNVTVLIVTLVITVIIIVTILIFLRGKKKINTQSVPPSQSIPPTPPASPLPPQQ